MVYLDNAATSYPKPQSVLTAATNAIRIYGGNPGRSGHWLSMQISEKVYQVREKLGTFFHAEPEQVVFTLNCTHALNLAIKGVMADGGHIILSNLDHNSVLRPIYAMQQLGRISYSIAEVCEEDPEQTVQHFKDCINRDTKAIVCSYASNVSGVVLPIAELSALCKEHGLIFIVDAAQAAGTFPIDVRTLGIDLLCAAGHKGLYGTTGTGVLIFSRELALATLMEGGTGSDSLMPEQPDFYPDRFESGTINTVGILSLGAGIDYLNSKPDGKLYRYEMALCTRLYHGLQQIPDIRLIQQSFRLGEKAPIVSFNIGDYDSTLVTDYFSQKGYMLRGGLHCAGLAHRYYGTERQGAVRFAPSGFNSTQQVNNFLREVKKIQKSGLSG